MNSYIKKSHLWTGRPRTKTHMSLLFFCVCCESVCVKSLKCYVSYWFSPLPLCTAMSQVHACCIGLAKRHVVEATCVELDWFHQGTRYPGGSLSIDYCWHPPGQNLIKSPFWTMCCHPDPRKCSAKPNAPRN